jgi:hypothetical protein
MWPDSRYQASDEGKVNTGANFVIVIALSAPYARL